MVSRLDFVVGSKPKAPKAVSSDAPRVAEIYDTDIYLWGLTQAEHIRSGCFDKVDLINAADEIEDVAKREYDSVVSHVAVILVHMLKWDYQPNKRSRSWTKSIGTGRDQIDYRLDGSPSLKAKRDEWLPKAYELARRRAARETNLEVSRFPETCPYSWSDIMTRPFVLDQTDETA